VVEARCHAVLGAVREPGDLGQAEDGGAVVLDGREACPPVG
jgi:hypothetical protein